ncbi:YhcB family protein [Agaribacterium haliotis]|uniref:YhcB family protein n=1 Tax=Agaribacterium haliotis TaxID=2013869 RepID=UPI001EFC8110|nr:YhcB family protein [Agaribacterium haliotis]
MFSLEVLIMISAIVFCIGGLLGAFISRSMFPPEQQKALEESLSNSRKELDQYQKDVAQHFAETAQLVNNLTQSYKNVHDHLASGALQLTNAEITQSMIAAGDQKLGLEAQESLDEQQVQAPRDWAPKAPGQTGTLSEEFGLDDSIEQHSPNDNKHSA